jgi:hypothetical protein
MMVLVTVGEGLRESSAICGLGDGESVMLSVLTSIIMFWLMLGVIVVVGIADGASDLVAMTISVAVTVMGGNVK